MGVILQAFFWDCPAVENRNGTWWAYVQGRLPELAATGFTALWLPPASKGGNIDGMSMGYDPYDFYDYGDFDQKGSLKTWFGNRAELTALIGSAHEQGLQVYADVVLNHNNGGDKQELNPIDQVTRWTKFNPKSDKFPRDWKCFHPSVYERWDGEAFGDMPDLCHRNPDVYIAMLAYGRSLVEELGFDGFRFDFVKGYGAWLVRSLMEMRYLNRGDGFSAFGVGECWDSDRTIAEWLAEANTWSDNPVSAFDFPLKWRLNDLCQAYGFSLRTLASGGTVVDEDPARAVTFVENHDTDRSAPVLQDKLLAYAFILTHEGYPSVFWRDYFNYGLAATGTPNGISALVLLHESHAGGGSSVLYVDDDLYVMQRSGTATQPGLILVLNNRGDVWNGRSVQVAWTNRRLSAAAWWSGSDLGAPAEKFSGADGTVDLWAPPRGYAVYIPM
jgi:alpha-amylase